MSDQNNRNNDIGSRIQQSVAEALMSGDFSKLNVEITSSVKEVLNDVGDQINIAVSEAKMGINNPQNRGFTSVGYRDIAAEDIARHQARREQLRKKQLPRVKFEEVGGFTGPLNIAAGACLFVMGLGLVASFGVFLVPVALLGVAAGAKGANKLKWLNIAKQYKKLASEKMYITVDTLSEATGLSQKQVVRNIKKILSKGFFPEGYLDESNTTFMVSKDIYNQYLETKNNTIVTEEATASEPESELNAMISEGMRYVDRLRELNRRIPGVAITEKLNRLEQLLNEIFNGLREHPDQMNNCRKLMDYYLPTMIKLVEAYAEYDKVSQPGPDILAAKKEIENTLDTINQAFVELLNKLYQSSVWDVTAEAKVLKTMLHQAGLTEENAINDGSLVMDGFDTAVTMEEAEESLLDMNQTAIEETVVNNV